MHGGDSLFGRMTSVTHNVYRDSVPDPDLDHKAHRVTEKLSENINTIANEPSVAFYRIQEHVRKTVPGLVEQKHEVEEIQQLVQGACFDTEYAGNAVKHMQKSVIHFQNIQELLKNAMFMKQQIDYEDARRRTRSPIGGGGPVRPDAGPGTSNEEGSSEMGDSAISTDSSVGASGGQANAEAADGNGKKRGEGRSIHPSPRSFNIQSQEDSTQDTEIEEATEALESKESSEVSNFSPQSAGASQNVEAFSQNSEAPQNVEAFSQNSEAPQNAEASQNVDAVGEAIATPNASEAGPLDGEVLQHAQTLATQSDNRGSAHSHKSPRESVQNANQYSSLNEYGEI